jgi:hypothetical protein
MQVVGYEVVLCLSTAQKIHNVNDSLSFIKYVLYQKTFEINEEEEPTRCCLVFYYTYDRLNMFRLALCPSSGAHGFISDYHMGRLILRLLMVG